jgi:2-C-methyl-D-erythritol 4-phosphate cytidylyltransferase
VFVVISPADTDFAKLALSKRAQARVESLAVGGATRQLSVENGLRALLDRLDAQDWILVHDAARPGITPELIGKLIAAVHAAKRGGLLALPLADTLKRGRHAGALAYSTATVPREGLWQAQTPQMFRHQELLEALRQARQQGTPVTDEASAMELAGAEPLLVPGHSCNFKVTYPDDLSLADQLLGLRS